MAFQTGDQARLAKILNLDREAYYQGSRLASLMSTLESIDASESSSLVADVRSNMTAIETLNSTIDTALETESEGVRRTDIPNAFSVEYFEGASASSGNSRKRDALIQQIRQLLDPDDLLRCIQSGGNILW